MESSDNSQQQSIIKVIRKRGYMTMLLHKVYHAEFKDMQLTRESGGLLYAIKTTKYSQTELARLFHITQASLSGRIKRLERDGYLVRVTEPKDRRKYRLELTAKANQELDEVIDKMNKCNAQIFQGVTDQDFEQILHFYDMISHNLEAMVKEDEDDQA